MVLECIRRRPGDNRCSQKYLAAEIRGRRVDSEGRRWYIFEQLADVTRLVAASGMSLDITAIQGSGWIVLSAGGSRSPLIAASVGEWLVFDTLSKTFDVSSGPRFQSEYEVLGDIGGEGAGDGA